MSKLTAPERPTQDISTRVIAPRTISPRRLRTADGTPMVKYDWRDDAPFELDGISAILIDTPEARRAWRVAALLFAARYMQAHGDQRGATRLRMGADAMRTTPDACDDFGDETTVVDLLPIR